MEVKTIAIQKVIDKNGKPIKWYTHGSKSFTYINIKDDVKVVVLMNGNKEYLLCKLLELDCIVFQSDSIINGLAHNKQLEELKTALNDKRLIVLLENDTSSLNTLEPIKKNLTTCKNIIPVHIEDLYLNYSLRTGTEVPTLNKGTDVIDFVNYVKDKYEFIYCLQDIYKGKLKNILRAEGA